MDNSITSHPGHDTLTSQNLSIFALFLGIIEVGKL